MFLTFEVSTMQHVTEEAFSKCEMNVTILQVFCSFQCNKILLIVKSLILDSFPYQGRQGKSD